MSSFLFRRTAAARADYDETARAAVLAAQEEAVALHHAVVRIEHFLLGVLAVEGPGRRVLEERFGIDLETARRDVTATAPRGERPPRGGATFDASTRPVLEHAAEAARGLGDARVTSAHVLLGVVATGGAAADLLAARGVDAHALQRAFYGPQPDEVRDTASRGLHRVVSLEGDAAAYAHSGPSQRMTFSKFMP